MRRERFIAGNWKMNKGASESLEFLRKLSVLLEQGKIFQIMSIWPFSHRPSI